MAWHAMHVLARCEDAVCERIHRRLALIGYAEKYQLLVPKRKMQERRSGNLIDVFRTMFPGYILVESDDIQEFAKIASQSKGVIRLLHNEDEFQEVRLEEIAQIVYMANEDGVIGTSIIIANGEYIEVLSGPLMGYEGYIKKIKHHQRAKVLFKFDGQDHLIDLPVRCYERSRL